MLLELVLISESVKFKLGASKAPHPVKEIDGKMRCVFNYKEIVINEQEKMTVDRKIR